MNSIISPSFPLLTYCGPAQTLSGSVSLSIHTSRRPHQPTISPYIPPLGSGNQIRRKMPMKIFAASPSSHADDNMDGGFWIQGLEDPFLAEIITKERKLYSAQIAKWNADAAMRKLGKDVAEKDPLWADLVAESKLLENLRSEFEYSKLYYMLLMKPKGMTEEAFEEKMYMTIMELASQGQRYTKVVAEWMIKYGTRLFEVDD